MPDPEKYEYYEKNPDNDKKKIELLQENNS